MSLTVQARPAAPVGGTRRRSALAQLTRVEFKLFLRERVGPIWGIGFPLLLLIIFGAIPAFRKVLPDSGGLTTLAVYVPIIIVMSSTLLAMVAMPLSMATARERGILRRLRTTPAGPARILVAQLLVNLATIVATVILVVVIARLAYGVPFPRQPGAWILSLVFVLAAVLAIGLFIAAVGSNGRAAGAIGNIFFFPLMFFSGLWFPIPEMPAVLQHISHATPLGAAWEAFQQAELGHWPPALALVAMAAWAAAAAAGAVRFFRWE